MAVSGIAQGPLSCSFDTSTGILSFSNPTSVDIAAGTPVVFTVSSFQNPYNGAPKTGFVVSIFDTVTGGKVDETIIMSVTSTEFADLLSPTLARDANDAFSSNLVGYFS